MKLCNPNRDWAAYFAERCEVNASGCWVWQRACHHSGYGQVTHKYVGQPRIWTAHRLAWTAFRGPIPDDLTVDHICFNTLCCNPEHLQLLTPLDNARRRRNAVKTRCAHGHEFTPENTIYQLSPKGVRHRACRICRRLSDQRRRARKKAAA